METNLHEVINMEKNFWRVSQAIGKKLEKFALGQG